MTLFNTYVTAGLIIAFVALVVDMKRNKTQTGLDAKDVLVIIFLWPLFLYFLVLEFKKTWNSKK